VWVFRIPEVGQARLGDQERAPRVDPVDEVVALHRRLANRPQRQRARVVDADVDTAERGDGRGDGALDLLLEADVAGKRQRAASRRFDLGSRGLDRPLELRVGLLRLGNDGDVGTVTRRALGDREPDAAAGAGDE
jgi:hypothetical protein